jgi:DNA-binding transcriptional LysR family regulator
VLFRQLEYFVALARERHFARAAAACYVSQPALSEAIRKLEQELNVPLVNRDHTFQSLTPEGERLVVWARRILADHDALQQEVSAMRSGLAGQLRLGVTATASTTAAVVLTPFCVGHPLVTVELETRLSTEDILSQLRRFELDAGIVHMDDADTTDLAIVPLYTERFVLAANRGLLPGDWSDRITWAELSELPLCMLDNSRSNRRLIDRLLKKNELVLRPRIETDSVASIYALVDSGSWAGVVPQEWIHAFRYSPDIRIITIDDPVITSTLSLVTSASEPGSLLARSLTETARKLSLDELFAQGPARLPAPRPRRHPCETAAEPLGAVRLAAPA